MDLSPEDVKPKDITKLYYSRSSKNGLADHCAGTAVKQLMTSYNFKLPRIAQIRKYRDLRNNKTLRQLRVRYNVPIPFFSGLLDQLESQLDDGLVMRAEENDPADWKSMRKINAALQQKIQSQNPGDSWAEKFRMARQECLMTGVGILKFTAGKNGGYFDKLEDIAFEDFHFEPKGGYNLDEHLFKGQTNIWLNEKDLDDGVEEGIYDKEQVKILKTFAANDYKVSSYWDNYDFANRFQSMNLASESNNYVGERVFNMAEWVLKYKGFDWYVLFEAYTGHWIRFEKLSEINSDGLAPWMAFHSHPDKKNFASKGFADDLYPVAIAATDMFNEDLENRKRMNSNARAFDKDMFTDVAAFDLAQTGRDRIVSADTKGGTRKIADGVYRFDTPQLTGTIDALNYLEQLVARNLGATPDATDKGDSTSPKSVGVAYAEIGQASKRISFIAQPIVETGQRLGMRFVCALKDYMTEPLSIKMFGEVGFEWDMLRRLDLNLRRPAKIIVSSQSAQNKSNDVKKANRMAALKQIIQPIQPGTVTANVRMVNEYILRDVGDYSEAEIALLLDPNSNVNKRTIAETSQAIQDLMMGRVPPTNYDATAYFLNRIFDFLNTHQGDKQVAKNKAKFAAYIKKHIPIAKENEGRRAQAYIQEKNAAALRAAAANPGSSMPSLPQPKRGGQAPSMPPQQPNNGLPSPQTGNVPTPLAPAGVGAGGGQQ